MKSPLLFAAAALFTASLLSGCAVYSTQEMARLEASRIAPPTMVKLRRSAPLSPEDVIELRRRGVPDALVLRHLDKEGVDSLFTRHEVDRLRGAGVSPRVIDASLFASDRFAAEHLEPDLTVVNYYGVGYGPLLPFYGGLGWGAGFCY